MVSMVSFRRSIKQYQRMEKESMPIESEKISQLLGLAHEKIQDLQQLVDGRKIVYELGKNYLL